VTYTNVWCPCCGLTHGLDLPTTGETAPLACTGCGVKWSHISESSVSNAMHKKPVAQPKSAGRCSNGDPCDGCADMCGPECTCDCHWQDTNLLPPDWYPL
jgi:hypothetical protein